MPRLCFILFFSILSLSLFSQDKILVNSRDDDPRKFQEHLAPFFHGVASGDPLEDRVIIWTRVTPAIIGESAQVEWIMASDPELKNVVASGTETTSVDIDYTVKVDVIGLDPGTTYYYTFKYNDQYSLVGRTKTVPTSDVNHLRFAVVSCSNYQAGYFNAYERIAERNDLDAVVHLGDYIYEYPERENGDENLYDERPVLPAQEIVTLDEYRIRYSTYRLDDQLIKMHQQHPIIAVWDDHEAANDSYKDGAQNHDASEGLWSDRKVAIKRTYFEWMPIRETEDMKVYRKIQYGDLVDLIMIDTRLEGREKQLSDITDPALNSVTRTILGSEQRQWLFTQLVSSDAKWKVIGNQVVFSEFNIGFAADFGFGASYESVESSFLDIWDGYPAERDRVIDLIDDNDIDNVVILTGDAHVSMAFDVSKRPSAYPQFAGVSNDNPDYNGDTQEGSVCVEFTTPSISSKNFNENVNPILANGLEFQINKPVPTNGVNPNPHMRYVDLDQHGYYILDVTPERVQADYFYSEVTGIRTTETFAAAFYTNDAQNKLTENNAPSEGKLNQDVPAPADPFMTTSVNRLQNKFEILGIHPNPASDMVQIQIALEEPFLLEMSIYNMQRKLVKKIAPQSVGAGLYTQNVQVGDFANGNYKVIIRSEGAVLATGNILVVK
jgi:alkaline phosphatase D